MRVLWVAVAIAAMGLGAGADERPNIVFIIADDLTYTDAGCYGNRDVRTPNIDRLATEGMRFTQAYTPVSMCSPARQCIYTGQFPVRSGAYPQRSRIEPDIDTLPTMMAALGYRVAIAGKRHYAPEEAYPFEFLGDRPIDFENIEAFMTRDAEQPFCLMVCSHEPHTPWDNGDPDRFDADALTLPPYFADTPRTRDLMRYYYAEVEYLDGQVGSVLSLLDKHDLTPNTLTMFCSEQGASVPFAKWTLYDAGMRAQLIARWPGHVEAGSTTDAMVQYCDLLPTWIDAAGGTPKAMDGKSFLPVLTGDATTHRGEVFGVHTTLGISNGAPYPIRAIRTPQYKLIWNLTPGKEFQNNLTEEDREWFFFNDWRDAAATNPKAKALVERYIKRPEFEFYDMNADPFERTNLATAPEHADTIKALHTRLQAWMTDQGDNGAATELAAPDRAR